MNIPMATNIQQIACGKAENTEIYLHKITTGNTRRFGPKNSFIYEIASCY